MAIALSEIAAIVWVGTRIGFGWTVLLLILLSALGANLTRREGARSWRQLRAAVGERRWPGDEVAQGALVLVGGALLVVPGFVTSVLGLPLLLRPSRRAVSRRLRRRVEGATFVGLWGWAGAHDAAAGGAIGLDGAHDAGFYLEAGGYDGGYGGE